MLQAGLTGRMYISPAMSKLTQAQARIERLEWFVHTLQLGLEVVAVEAERINLNEYSVGLHISVRLQGKTWPLAATHPDYRNAVFTLVQYRLEKLLAKERKALRSGDVPPRTLTVS
jgi:hypothetical protein